MDTPRTALSSPLLPNYYLPASTASATHLHIVNGHLILRSVEVAACSTHDSNTCDSLHSNKQPPPPRAHRITKEEEEEEEEEEREIVFDANKSSNYYFTATCWLESVQGEPLFLSFFHFFNFFLLLLLLSTTIGTVTSLQHRRNQEQPHRSPLPKNCCSSAVTAVAV